MIESFYFLSDPSIKRKTKSLEIRHVYHICDLHRIMYSGEKKSVRQITVASNFEQPDFQNLIHTQLTFGYQYCEKSFSERSD